MTGADGQVIKLAILAVGGQGGGVLTNWIVELALACGWQAQATAVAGVAQRTGATIYYIEMAPASARRPVFALAPAPGDVDILMAAEWMEAGRAVLRGFVTPDRTCLIASTHRALAVAEKIVPGDGVAAQAPVENAVHKAARRVLAFDMQAPAAAAGSVISATLFGALARSAELPFDADRFRAVVAGGGGKRAQASLAAFEAGFSDPDPAPAPHSAAPPGLQGAAGPAAAMAEWQNLVARAMDLPQPIADMAVAGLRAAVDFQDLAYGAEYLEQVERVRAADSDDPWDLTVTAAKYLARAMAYDDVIAVADRKTRGARMARIGTQMQVGDRGLHVTEFLHPRIEEVCGTLPRGLGAWIEARPRLAAWLDRRINRGRRVRTDTILGFVQLYLVAGLRRRRRGTLRHQIETDHRMAWLDLALHTARTDYALAVEILACRRLIKGYSDTHARGTSKYDRVIGALEMLHGRADAADWLRRLREAALQDADGVALEGALRTVASFAKAPPARAS